MKSKIFVIVMIFIFVSLLNANSNKGTHNLQRKYVETLVESLADENPIVRNNSAENLITIGPFAVPFVIDNFSKDNYQIRKKKVLILSKIGNEECIEFLLKTIRDHDLGVRTAAAHALLNLSDKFPLLQEVKKMQSNPGVNQQIIDDLINSIIYKEVETELYNYVSPDGNSGYFDGQFKNLQEKWKDEAILPILDIFSDQSYRYIHLNLNDNDSISLQMRFLAGEALADLKKSYTPDLKTTVHAKLTTMKRQISINPIEKYISELIDNILYHIGYTDDFEREVEKLKTQLRYFPNNTEILFNLGMKYLRIREVDEGIKYLKLALAIAPDDGLTYYNLACAYSIAGKLEEAVSALEKSVDYGYEDLDWMLKDGDLRNIRKHPKFEELVKRLEKKKKK